MNIPDDIDAARRRRDQMAELLRQADAEERRKAAAAEEEERRRQLVLNSSPGVTTEELRAELAALDQHIHERETHLRWEAQREAVSKRAERLAAEIEIEETRTAEKRIQLSKLIGNQCP